ncbi:hypothetical protein FACS18949_18470 [Clostridia bacterium]|nr:hypothetical protein FACS18949_18470 [Clostridia bacterium]
MAYNPNLTDIKPCRICGQPIRLIQTRREDGTHGKYCPIEPQEVEIKLDGGGENFIDHAGYQVIGVEVHTPPAPSDMPIDPNKIRKWERETGQKAPRPLNDTYGFRPHKPQCKPKTK